MIRAFYSNLKKDENGELSTKINGVTILLSEENIQTLTNLPREGQDIVKYTGDEDIFFDEQVLFQQMGIKHFEWTPELRCPSITNMLPEFRLIFYIITRILKPRKYNHTTIGREDAKIMHAIINKAHINWCKFILTHMHDSIGDDKPLPYAFLIMIILEAMEISTNIGPKKNRTKIWEIQETSFRSGDHPAPPPPPPTQQTPQPSRRSDITLESISEQIASLSTTLSTSIDRIDRNVSRTERHVRRLSNELHGYFDHVNYPYTQVHSSNDSSDEFDDDF